jgi:hypothetical protein
MQLDVIHSAQLHSTKPEHKYCAVDDLAQVLLDREGTLCELAVVSYMAHTAHAHAPATCALLAYRSSVGWQLEAAGP